MRPPEPCVRRHLRLVRHLPPFRQLQLLGHLRLLRRLPRLGAPPAGRPSGVGQLSRVGLSCLALSSPALPALVLPAVLLSAERPLSAAAAVAGGAWQWPLLPRPELISGFLAPADPYGPGARGVDLAATVGEPVRAAAAGTIAFVGLVAGTPVVTVDHGSIVSTYEPVVSGAHAGQRIPAGAPVGTVAALPRRCGVRTCLHWGAYLEGSVPRTYLDPLALLDGGPVRLLPDDPVPRVPELLAGDPTPGRPSTRHQTSPTWTAAGGRRPSTAPAAVIGAGPAPESGRTADAGPTPAAVTGGGRRTHRLAVTATVAVLVGGSALLAPMLLGPGSIRPARRSGARRGPAGSGSTGRDR